MAPLARVHGPSGLAILLAATWLLTAGAGSAMASGTGLAAAGVVPSVPTPSSDLLGGGSDDPTPEADRSTADDHEEELDDHAASTATEPGLLERFDVGAVALTGVSFLLAGAALAHRQLPERRPNRPEGSSPEPAAAATPGPQAEADDPFLAQAPPEGVEGVLAVARAHLSRDEHAAAASWFELAADLAPDRPTPHFCRGLCLERLDRVDEAMAAYDSARRAGADATPLYRQARLLAAGGRPQDALERLREALDAEPALREDAVHDEAFASLGDHPRFLALIGEL